MSDTETILQALKDHRDETRQDMHELRGAVVKIADAAADMGKTMARSEERHSNNEETQKRMGRTIDDHEGRLRIIEIEQPTAEAHLRHARDIEAIKSQLTSRSSSVTGGWKVLTVMGGLVLGIIALSSLLVRLVA